MIGDPKNEVALSPQQIISVVYGFQGARILLTAYELGVFSAIHYKSMTSEDIAKELDTDVRATDRLLNALCALDFLKKRHNLFSNTPITLKYMVDESPDYLSGLMHSRRLIDRWATLTEAVKKGTFTDGNKITDSEEASVRDFIAAMHDRGKREAPEVAEMIDIDNVTQILDIGGGSGAFCMAFVHLSEDIYATVFDLPNVIPITEEYIKNEGLSVRIKTKPGDYHKDSLGEGYDLVFLSQVIHSNSPDENIKLLKKCYKACSTNGQIVIQDFIMNEDRISPQRGAVFALNMLVNTEGGDTYTESEVNQWLTDAGFNQIRREETPFGTTLLMGKK